MITREQILDIANAYLAGGELYITGVKISADNHISVFIDGDKGVSIKDCVALSRVIEASIDREKEDFALDVSSHGATSPLQLPRQYFKNLGRTLEVRLLSGEKAEGTLTACDEEKIRLEFALRENKPVGKGKITVRKTREIAFNEIKEARIKLKF